jgi:UDP-GlcNAc:undecaprenyl-phosphate GlcNAc-1-phosphate transferase
VALAWRLSGISPDLDHPGGLPLLFFVIGLADDLFALPPWPRLAGRSGGHGGLEPGGSDRCHRSALRLAVRGHPLPEPLSLLATVIWLVGITNAINWLDGLDGLAAGVSGIAAVGLLSVSFSACIQPPLDLLAAALAGSCLGFLRHNFNPARIFMGDGGSYFLGFALAAISIVGPAKGLDHVSLLLPLLDPVVAAGRHVRGDHGPPQRGASPFYPDRRHLHHRLLRAGFSHRRTVLLIYAFTQWLAALALVVAGAELRFLWLALATAVLIAAVTICRRSLSEKRAGPAGPGSLTAEVLCVGSELLLGNITNGNARWIAQQLAALGLPHQRQMVVGDNRERLMAEVAGGWALPRLDHHRGAWVPPPMTSRPRPSPLPLRPPWWSTPSSGPRSRRACPLAAESAPRAIAAGVFAGGCCVLPNPTGTAPGMIWSPVPISRS